jgi:hypothetical protein
VGEILYPQVRERGAGEEASKEAEGLTPACAFYSLPGIRGRVGVAINKEAAQMKEHSISPEELVKELEKAQSEIEVLRQYILITPTINLKLVNRDVCAARSKVEGRKMV